LQVLAAVSRALEQPAGAHSVPAACSRHAPLPLHPPDRPQLEAGSPGQSLSGSSPSGTGVQVPTRPATLQAWQGSVQAVPQQTPFVQ
jgi:hypothetical protein